MSKEYHTVDVDSILARLHADFDFGEGSKDDSAKYIIYAFQAAEWFWGKIARKDFPLLDGEAIMKHRRELDSSRQYFSRQE